MYYYVIQSSRDAQISSVRLWGRAVTKFTNLLPDPIAIYFVKLIYFNVNTYMGQ